MRYSGGGILKCFYSELYVFLFIISDIGIVK